MMFTKKWSLLVFAAFLLLAVACKIPKNASNNNLPKNNTDRPNRYFPEVMGDLVLNMTLEQVLEKRPMIAPVNYLQDVYSFRKEFSERIDSNGIVSVTYYFDAEGLQPFYELIINYKSEEERDKDAVRLLGQANYLNNTEWLIESRQDFKVRIWKHENKLVVAGLLPGTEWGDEIPSGE